MDGKSVPRSSVPEDVAGWVTLTENQRGALTVSRGSIDFQGEIHEVLITAPAGPIADWLVSFREPSGAMHRVLVEGADRGRAAGLAWSIVEQECGDPFQVTVRMDRVAAIP